MTAIQESRLWLLAGTILTLAVVSLGWLFIVVPRIDAVADIRSRTQDAQVQNQTLSTRVAQLRAADANLDQLRANLDTARLEFPVRNDTDTLSASLQRLAERNLVAVTSISVGAPVDVTATAQGQVADAGAEAATDPAGSADTSNVRSTYALPVTITVAGKATAVDGFISDTQARGQRAILVTKTVIVPADGISGGSVSGDIVASYSGFAYVSPLTPAAAQALSGEETPTDG